MTIRKSVAMAACSIAMLCLGLSPAQSAFAQSASPAAYVYVITHPHSNAYEIDGYKADSTGALTRLAGSPFWRTPNSLLAMAHTAHWLFASDGASIYTFSIASNGRLKLVSSVNAAQYYGFPGQTGDPLVLDHTGSTLYGTAADGVGDNEFQFFNKDNSTGDLSFIGSSGTNISYGQLFFTGSNKFAYGFGCFQATSHSYGFQRGADGSLTQLNQSVPVPTYPSGDFCLDAGTANPANNMAVAMYLETASGGPGPPAWLGVYTVDRAGNLTTNSTYQDMPTSDVGSLSDILASPEGNLLALAGSGGLQIFHFNGSHPITHYTGLLAVHNISEIHWDNRDHLFGISKVAGLLYAFKITATGHKQAKGSPYSVSRPQAIAVLSK